jgi:hypothetical protein
MTNEEAETTIPVVADDPEASWESQLEDVSAVVALSADVVGQLSEGKAVGVGAEAQVLFVNDAVRVLQRLLTEALDGRSESQVAGLRRAIQVLAWIPKAGLAQQVPMLQAVVELAHFFAGLPPKLELSQTAAGVMDKILDRLGEMTTTTTTTTTVSTPAPQFAGSQTPVGDPEFLATREDPSLAQLEDDRSQERTGSSPLLRCELHESGFGAEVAYPKLLTGLSLVFGTDERFVYRQSVEEKAAHMPDHGAMIILKFQLLRLPGPWSDEEFVEMASQLEDWIGSGTVKLGYDADDFSSTSPSAVAIGIGVLSVLALASGLYKLRQMRAVKEAPQPVTAWAAPTPSAPVEAPVSVPVKTKRTFVRSPLAERNPYEELPPARAPTPIGRTRGVLGQDQVPLSYRMPTGISASARYASHDAPDWNVFPAAQPSGRSRPAPRDIRNSAADNGRLPRPIR